MLNKKDSSYGFDLCGRQLDENSVVLSRGIRNMTKFTFTKWDKDYISPTSKYYYRDSHGYRVNSCDSFYGIVLEDFYSIIPSLVEKSNFNMGMFKKDYIQLSLNDLKEILLRLNPNKKMFELLNKDLFISDLVVYIDSNDFRYGIVTSDKSIYSQVGVVKSPKWVYKIKNLTENEVLLREKLKLDYLNIMDNTVVDKSFNVGAIYKFGNEYYINLGRRKMTYTLLRPTDVEFNFTIDESKVLWGKFSWNTNKFFSEENGWKDSELYDFIISYIRKTNISTFEQYFISENFYTNYTSLHGFRGLVNVDNLNKFKFKRKIKLPKNIEIFHSDYKIILTEI